MEYLQSLLSLEKFLLFKILAVCLFTLLLNYSQRYILRRLAKSFAKTNNYWDDAVVDALPRPLSAFIWLLGVNIIIRFYENSFNQGMFDAIMVAYNIIIVMLFTWFCVLFIKQIENKYTAKYQAAGELHDITTANAIAQVMCICVVLICLLHIAQMLGYSVSGILAFGGIGGIAVGFAAKDLLANFFGGLMVYLDRPFNVGDWVISPDKQIEGTVINIGWRLTEIQTFQKRPIYVPNSVFTKIVVENPSRMTHRRIYETIGVRYDDVHKIAAIIFDVKQMLIAHPDIDDSQTLIVNFNEFAHSSLDFFIYTFTHTTNWIKYHDVKEDVLLKIIAIIEAHGAECAFPTSTLHIIDKAESMPSSTDA